MDWEKQLQVVEDNEAQNRSEHIEEKIELNYTGAWDFEGYKTEHGQFLSHGEMWELLTCYKYMSKFANVYDDKGVCILDKTANKLDNLLELGCDWGHCWSVFEYVAKNVYGIEATKWSVDIGKEKSRNITHGLMESTPYEDGFFDLVCSNHVLEHGVDPDTTLKEIRRITKKGGWSVHTLPCRVDRWVEEQSLIHKSVINNNQWLMKFVTSGFSIKNSFFMWNHNQEDFTIIARTI